MSKKNMESTRELMGTKEVTNYSVRTYRNDELVYFLIQPSNISVLSQESLSARIYGLMTVLKGITEIEIDLYEDISKVAAEDILRLFGKPDVIWASPDCSTFSIAAISHHRRKNPETGSLEPVSAYAKFCDMVDQHVLKLIEELQPKYYFIENPRGGMRKMEWMKGLSRYTVTYCQYGDNRMKPTDIWTNHPDPKFLPMCHNGDSCHVAAPRGSKTGTQGLKGARERSVIPQKLCDHIVDICEE